MAPDFDWLSLEGHFKKVDDIKVTKTKTFKVLEKWISHLVWEIMDAFMEEGKV